MSPRYIPALCIVLLVVAFGIDLVTPQLFVAAILLDAPIVLSSFTRSRSFTTWLVVAALAANALAGYVNGVMDHYHWDAIGIGDRLLAAASILCVGFLSVGIQESAQRAGVLVARQLQSQRESALRRAFDVIRSSINPEYVYRAIVRESIGALDVDAALLYISESTAQAAAMLEFERGGADVTVTQDRPPPELLSLITRAQDEGEVLAFGRGDAFGRLILDTLKADYALTAPLVDRSRRYGVLIVARKSGSAAFDAEARALMRAFCEQAGNALSQAHLFVQLAEKNDEFAEANRELAARSDVIRDIVYALSHDLRTPLAAAQMTIRQALDGAYGPLPEAYRDILRQSLSSNDELQRLAETLLLVASYESNEQSRIREPVDLAALAPSVLAELRPLWSAKNIDAAFRLEPGEAEPVVRGDEGELRRVLINLVANAVAWTPEGGTVTIVVAAANGTVQVRVEDDGYGVPEALRPALFGRLVNRQPRRGAGSGLGLYIVRRIVENHGGRVSYSPREPRGSTFTVELPAAAAASAAGR